MGIGERIKKLRVKNNLTQEELAVRCELTVDFVSQMERDAASPSISILISILECLGTNLKDFFYEKNQEKIVFTSDDFFVAVNKGLSIEKKWVVPNFQRNLLEPVLVDFEIDGKTEEEGPHGGEEFGYVLSGTVNIHMGERKFRADKGESFSFRPVTTHYISNGGNEKASVLWVTTRLR